MCFPAIGAAVVGPTAAKSMSALSLGMIGASTVASVASPLVSYAGQRQQAKAQAKYQRQAQAAEDQRFLAEQSAIRMQEAQKQKAAGEEINAITMKTRDAMGTAVAQAANRGVTGLSLEAFYGDIERQAGNVQLRIAQQQEMGEVGTAMALEQAGFVTTQRQIALAKPIKRPSLALSGFQALSGGLDAYTRGRQIGATYES